MILKTLVENTSVSSEFKNKHGLCFYIETDNHKILFDLGKNGLFAKIGGNISVDDFSHEQSLIISENKKFTLITGCSHTGIVNIKNKTEHIVNEKITSIVGGFHLYNPVSKTTESDELMQETIERLDDNSTCYYTCHCTGEKAFLKMKQIFSERLMYLATGSKIEL